MAGPSFYSNKPRYTDRKIVSVAEAQSQIAAFNAFYEVTSANSSVSNCKDPNKAANWRKYIRDGVINDIGRPRELDWFQKIAGGAKKDTPATAVYTKTNVDVDFNIVAQASVVGASAGAATTFLMHRGMYDATGNYSNVAVGGSLYIYEDRQSVQITAVNRDTPFATSVTVIPNSKAYTVNIRGGSKMLFSPVRVVGGKSCPIYSSTWITDGFISVVRPYMNRVDRKFDKELDRPYEDVLQFGIMFDINGKEIDGWQYRDITTMREELKWRQNWDFFAGQPIDNPLLTANLGGAGSDIKYTGYFGYLPTVEFGGGTVQEFDPTIGYDFDSDFDALTVRQDAIKQTTEFFGYAGRQFIQGMNRRMTDTIRNSSGQCTFQTFNRMGDWNDQSLTKYRVMSYSYAGYSLHFKQLDALTDSRMGGNGIFPNLAMLMPGDSITDSKGNTVPAIEIYNPMGSVEGTSYKEYVRDQEKVGNGCDEVQLEIRDTTMVAINAPSRHIILRPQTPAAA